MLEGSLRLKFYNIYMVLVKVGWMEESCDGYYIEFLDLDGRKLYIWRMLDIC